MVSALVVYRFTPPCDYSSRPPSESSFSSRRPNLTFFFFHRRLQSVHDDLLRRRSSSFFHPLNHPASTLSSRALNVWHHSSLLLSDYPLLPSFSSLAHSRDSEIFFQPSSLPFRDVSSPSSPSTPTHLLSRRTSSISCNLAPASLRNPQTPDAYQQRKRRRTKDEITSGPITHAVRVYIYSRSHRGLLSGESRDGNSIRTSIHIVLTRDTSI